VETKTPGPLDYQSRLPSLQPPRRKMFSFFAMYVGAIFTAIVTVTLAFVEPKFERMFRDFGTRLPSYTLVFTRLSLNFVRYFLWLPFWMLPIAFGFCFPLMMKPDASVSEQKRARRIVIRVALLATSLFILITFLCLFKPLIDLLEAVSRPAR
jgi:type II secretory pathway component PulF